MSSSSHHRSYSDAPDSLNRLRLPPISNLIEGSHRPDEPFRRPFSSTQLQPQVSSNIPQSRQTPVSPGGHPWSPASETRPPYRQELPPRYQQHTTSEHYQSWPFDRRPSMATPQSVGSEVPAATSPGSQLLNSDPLSPNSRTTAKAVVREDMIPGKGPCYVYDDGTVCQKYINGDTVNPKWGTTKAGRPRKRLGQACNTCREKKIKCDPSYPKCTQCQKFGRECRFEAPLRTGNKSPKMRSDDSPTALPTSDDSIPDRRSSVALTDASSHSESGTISSQAARTADDHLSPLTNDSNFPGDTPGPSKKAKLSLTDPELTIKKFGSYNERPYPFALEVDPFDVSKKLTQTYLHAYFQFVNGSAFSLIPEHAFLQWAEKAEEKSQVSKLVLYCMLAVGCQFSKSPEKAEHGRMFTLIALEGITQSLGHYSVQLIQARLIFALGEFQQGREDKAWDICGFAMRTACAMNLNTEEGIAQHVRDSSPIYGLDSARLLECTRRTFWVAYSMDNLGMACLCITTTLRKVECSLRLPCSKVSFESGSVVKTPVFDGELVPVKASDADLEANVGTLGYLAQIASLCCDIRTLAFKATHQASYVRHKRYGTAREDLEGQLRLWNDRYTARIKKKYSKRTPLHGDYTFSFGGLHLVYHYACMQFYRHQPHTHLSRNTITEYAQLTYHHAEKTLAIAQHLMGRNSQDIVDYHFAAASPLSGYAIHYAIDVLSAAGVNARLLENQSPVLDLLINSVQLLDRLAEVWPSAKIQQKQVSDRMKFAMNSARAGISDGKIGFCMEEPMVTSLGKEEDLIYGVDRMLYLKSFNWADQIHNPSDLTTVSSKGKRGSYSLWKD